ncbi:hypothetical protein ACFW04_013663 [Cataglyphis niger]
MGSYTLHYGGSEIHNFDVGFINNKKILSMLKNIKFINERLGLLVVQGKWYQIVIISVPAPIEIKIIKLKTRKSNTIYQLPNDYMKIVLGNFNAKIGKENIFRWIIGLESLHKKSINNGIKSFKKGGLRLKSFFFIIAKIRERFSTHKTNEQLMGSKRLNREKKRDKIRSQTQAAVGFCKRNRNKLWFDEEYLAHNTEETRDQFLNNKQAAHVMFKNKKHQYVKSKKYMKIIKAITGARTEVVINGKLITDAIGKLKTWKNNFDGLLNIHTAQLIINEPMIVEVKSARSKLLEEIHKLINIIEIRKPKQWKDSIVIPIFKKKDKINMYDSIKRKRMFKILIRFGISKKIGKLNSNLFNKCERRWFAVERYNSIINNAGNIVLLRNNSKTIINNTKLNLLDKTKELGLQINVEKTKYIIIVFRIFK